MSTLSVASITNLGAVSIGNATINSTTISVGSNVVINTIGITVTGTLVDSIGNIRELPQTIKIASYTLLSTDSGKFISTNSNIIVPNTGFSNGQNISIYNNSTANITISSDAGATMYWAGTSNTSSRTLLQKGFSTIICVAAANYVISGAGLV